MCIRDRSSHQRGQTRHGLHVVAEHEEGGHIRMQDVYKRQPYFLRSVGLFYLYTGQLLKILDNSAMIVFHMSAYL